MRRGEFGDGHGRGPPAHQPHPLGPHPGPAVLLAALHARQPASRLRPPARRHAPAGGVRLADREPVLPGAARRAAGRRRRSTSWSRARRFDDRTGARSAARGSTTRGSRWPTASTSTARRWSTAPTPRRSPTSCSSTSSSASRRRRASRSSRARPPQLRRHARRAGRAVPRRRPAHLRHPVHARGVPAEAALGPLDARRRDRDRARGRGQARWRCSTTRRCAPTTSRTRSSTAVPRGAARRRPLELGRRLRGPRARRWGADERAMKIRFWGVRGSIPAPGPGDQPLRRQHVVRVGRRRDAASSSSSTWAPA